LRLLIHTLRFSVQFNLLLQFYGIFPDRIYHCLLFYFYFCNCFIKQRLIFSFTDLEFFNFCLTEG
jgi:hypothetical protein